MTFAVLVLGLLLFIAICMWSVEVNRRHFVQAQLRDCQRRRMEESGTVGMP